MLKQSLLRLIDFFYPAFKQIFDLQTFRYAVCGGSNAFLNLFIFSFSYNVIFEKEVVVIFGFLVTQYIAAYLIALSICFPLGFCLNKYLVFQQSNLQSKTQLMRYAFVAITSIGLDYTLLHVFVGYFQFWATGSQAAIIVFLSLYSYFCQTYFTFKTVK